jgi:hypothetical protein
MKKMMLMLLLLAVVAGSALPAVAMEVDFSGSFELEGILNSSEGMDKDDATSDFRQMRLRVQTEFTVTDDLKLITRFDALEKILSSKDSSFTITETDTGWDSDDDDDNIDFDRAYLSWKSPIGLFQLGRMEGVTWGTSFCDDEADTDRIKYILPISLGAGTFYLSAVAEKVGEYDKGTDDSDEDNDKYYIGATYVAKNYKTGLLTALYNFKTFQDPGQALATEVLYAYAGSDADTILNPAMSVTEASTLAGTRGLSCEGKVFLLAPYFEGKFGDFSLTAELDYIIGTTEYDTDSAEDGDLKAFAYLLEGAYDIGPASVQLGFARSKGDADYTDDKIGSMSYVSPGVDWAKLLILQDDTTGMNTTLAGGLGNHVGNGFGSASTAMCDGYQLLYAGVDYAVTDTISLGFIAGMSWADEVPDGMQYDDDQGVEYDASFTWNLTKNLEYKAVAAYLDGGDYWKTRATGSVDADIDPEIYTLYHKLTLTF